VSIAEKLSLIAGVSDSESESASLLARRYFWKVGHRKEKLCPLLLPLHVGHRVRTNPKIVTKNIIVYLREEVNRAVLNLLLFLIFRSTRRVLCRLVLDIGVRTSFNFFSDALIIFAPLLLCNRCAYRSKLDDILKVSLDTLEQVATIEVTCNLHPVFKAKRVPHREHTPVDLAFLLDILPEQFFS